jgi:hypothetical protein
MTPNAVYEAAGITLLAIRGGRVSQMTRFAFPRLFPLFGLPSHLPSGGTAIEDRSNPWPGTAAQHTEATTRRD